MLRSTSVGLLLLWACGAPLSPVIDRANAPDEVNNTDADFAEVAPTPLIEERTQAQPFAGAPSLVLPQFIAGAASVNPLLFPQITVDVAVAQRADAVVVQLNGVAVAATQVGARDGTQWAAALGVDTLPNEEHKLVATASFAGQTIAQNEATLLVSRNSVRLTEFAQQGGAFTGTLLHDRQNDRLVETHLDRSIDKTSIHAFMRPVDGAGRPLGAAVRLDPDANKTLRLHTALGDGTIGVLAITEPTPGVWKVWLRVVDGDGAEVVAAVELTAGGQAALGAAIAFDGSGYVAVWKQVLPNNNFEVRLVRLDVATRKLAPFVSIMRTDDGGGSVYPLGLMAVACSKTLCVVPYVRFVSVNHVDLSKVFLGVVDMSHGRLISAKAISAKTADAQDDVAATKLADDSFLFAYTGTDLGGVRDACDNVTVRYLVYQAHVTAAGVLAQRQATTTVDAPGGRSQPVLAPYSNGAAIAWSDERSTCVPDGAIRMAVNVNGADGRSVDPYREVPGSVLLSYVWPTLTSSGSNVIAGWLDNRRGNGLADMRPELMFETFWR